MVERRRDQMHIAECFWPDVHEDWVERAAQRIRQSAAELTRAGAAVNLSSTILLPGDDVVFYLFNGSADAVSAACERADVRYERVVGAVELHHRADD